MSGERSTQSSELEQQAKPEVVPTNNDTDDVKKPASTFADWWRERCRKLPSRHHDCYYGGTDNIAPSPPCPYLKT